MILDQPVGDPGEPARSLHALNGAASDRVGELVEKRVGDPALDLVLKTLMPDRLVIRK